MITDILPTHICDLIVSVYGEGIKDPEIDTMLPPSYVRAAVLAEKGITAPLTEEQQQTARDWCKLQSGIQDRAMQVSYELNKREPLTQLMAMRGELPKWAIEGWAMTLLLDWSDSLEEAVVAAENYLNEAHTASR